MPIAKCSIDLCRCHANNCTLTVYPRHRTLNQIWSDVVKPYSKRLRKGIPKGRLKICIHHFEPQYRTARGRKIFSCPTLFTKHEIDRKTPRIPVCLELEETEKIKCDSSDDENPISKTTNLPLKRRTILDLVRHDHSYKPKRASDLVNIEKIKYQSTPDKNSKITILPSKRSALDVVQHDHSYKRKQDLDSEKIKSKENSISKISRLPPKKIPILDLVQHDHTYRRKHFEQKPDPNTTSDPFKNSKRKREMEPMEQIIFIEREPDPDPAPTLDPDPGSKPDPFENSEKLEIQTAIERELPEPQPLESETAIREYSTDSDGLESIDWEIPIKTKKKKPPILENVKNKTRNPTENYLPTVYGKNLAVPHFEAYNVAKYFDQSGALEFEDDVQFFDDFNARYVNKEVTCTVEDTSPDQLRTNEENLVLHHQGFLKEKLRSVLYSHRFCAVCFESNKTFKSLDEELTIISDNWTQTILLKHVYTYVFKQTETSASGYICTECTTQLQQAYIFIKYSQLTSSLLNEYIDDAQSKIASVHNLNKEGEKTHNKTIIMLKSHELNKYLVPFPYEEQNTSECKTNYKCDNITSNSFWDEGIEYIEPYKSETGIQNELIALNTQLKDIVKIHLTMKQEKASKTTAAICEFCSKEYRSNDCLPFHYADEHTKVECKVCNIVIDEDILKSHLMKEHAEDVYLCNVCDNPFYTLKRIQIHARIMHGIHDTSTINWMDPPKRSSKAREINDVSALCCPECSETPCIHIKYLNTYLEQTLNHTFALAKCADCDFVTRTKAALVRHANVEHLKHCPHICDQCGSQFYCKQTLKHHIKTFHQTKKVYICKYCDEQFKSSDIVSNHETSCSSIERAYRCEHCTASFNTYELLQKHHKLRHKEVFPCQYCNKEFLTEASRKQHITRVHRRVRIPTKQKFVCDICQEEFNSKSKLKAHIKDHGPNVKYQCKICNIEYGSLNQLKKHNYTLRHNMPSVACNICGKQIKQVLLEKHLEEHKLDAEVSCYVCERRFNNIARLRTHMECHLGTRKKKKQIRVKLKCQSCDYYTVTHGELETHINEKHLHIKPFACLYCQKTFYGQRLLNSHIRIWHLPRKRCPCPVCGKELYRTVLKRHIELHNGVKRFACSLCEEKFVTSDQRYRHVRKKHIKKSECCCPLCPRKFSQTNFLCRHIIAVHWKDDSNDANRFDPREVKGLENHYHLFPRWLEKQNESNHAASDEM